MSYTLRAKRTLAGAASGAMILALVPASMAAADTEAVCENAPEDAFTDVNPGGAHSDNIDCIAAYGITTGSANEGEYDPWGAVSRGQMGSFLHEFLEVADAEEYPVPATTSFDDVEGTTHENGIKVIEEQGITTGTAGGDSYEPRAPVTRGQMATFVAETIEVLGGELDANPPNAFADDDGTTHEEAIDQLAAAGVVSGRLDGTFGPNDTITRAQMASYLAEAAGFLDDQGEWHSTLEAPEEPVTSNQTFTVTPADEATNVVSTASGDDANRGQRQYEVTGLDNTADYDLFLFPAEYVTEDADGIVTFRDNESSGAGNNVADWTATSAIFEVVNGAAVSDANGTVLDISPVNGSIQFSIDSQAQDQVIPVIVAADTGSTDGNPDVDLNADNEPTEAFGIGGQKNWIPAEAAAGVNSTPRDITAVDKDENYFIAGGATYYYDANDNFQLRTPTGTGACVSTTATVFERELSVGDDLFSSIYTQDEDASSTFCLDDTDPAAPAGVSATAQGDDVTVSWSAVTGADAYRVLRSTTTGTGYSQIAEVTTTSYTDSDLADGTYYYVVRTVDGEEVSGNSNEASATVPGAGDTQAPTADYAGVVDDNGFQGEADTGDVWTIFFSEAVSVADGDVIRVDDAEGEFANVVLGTDATWTLTNSNRELDLTLTSSFGIDGDNDGTATNNTGELEYPLTIINQNGITDLAGNPYDVSTGDDQLVIDVTVPSMVSAASSTDDVVVVTYTEPVKAMGGTVDLDQFTYDVGGAALNPQSASISGDEVTLTFASGSFTPAQADGVVLTYTDDNAAAVDNGDLVDLAGLQANPNDTVSIDDTEAPTIQSATFTDADGDPADFDGTADTIALKYDETMVLAGGTATVTIDGTTYTCGGVNVGCAVDGTDDTVINVTWITLNDIVGVVGLDVEDSAGITDVATNEAIGYPETIG